MRFHILGPLYLQGRSGRIPLAGQRMARVLAVLLLNNGELVPLHYLIDAVWDDGPPATAKRQIQNCVSALRRSFAEHGEPDPIRAVEGRGYQIALRPGDLDAQVFTEQVGAARLAAAAGHLPSAVDQFRSALRLWRGPTLAGLAGRQIAAAASSLDEQRFSAMEECLDLELRLGRQQSLIGELTGLVAEHPLRERLVGQLMVALCRQGRQAEAIQAYHRLRETLAEETGLDPGPDLQSRYAQILNGQVEDGQAEESRGEATASGPVVTPVQLPIDVAGFDGRDRYLKEIDGLLPAAVQGPTTGVGTVAIVGMAGVGKTSLAVHWAHQVADRFPDGRLYVDLRGFDPSGSAMPVGEAVRGFLDAFGVPPDQVPATEDAQVALYRSLLVGRRVLVVLDNARDVEQVRPLLPAAKGCFALVTSRNQLSGLVAVAGARLIGLDLLTGPEARQLLASRLGDARVEGEQPAVDELITRCAGLPLALAVVAARAATYPTFPLAALATELRQTGGDLDVFSCGDPNSDIRSVLSWSYRRLSVPAARLFRQLGIHPGPDLTLPAAASLAGKTRREVRPLVAELTRANLVTEHLPGRYQLHDLLRAYATELVGISGPERGTSVRRTIDHYLHTACLADRRLDPYRDPITLEPPAIGVTPEEIEDHAGAMAWFSAELPVLHRVIAVADGGGFDAHTWRLVWTMAHFFERQGHWNQWIDAQRIGLAAAERLADLDAQALGSRSLGRANVHLDRPGDAMVHLDRAMRLFGQTGNRVGQARIQFDLAWLASRQGRHREELRCSREALGHFEAEGHRSGQARAMTNVGWALTQLGDHRGALSCFQQARVQQERIGDGYGLADTLDGLGLAHHRLGEYRQAIEDYWQAIDRFRDLGDRFHETETLTHIGDTYQAVGEVETALALWRRAVAILEDLGHPDAERVRGKLNQLG